MANPFDDKDFDDDLDQVDAEVEELIEPVVTTEPDRDDDDRPSRRERRQERGREWDDQRLETELQARDRRIAELEQRVQSPPQPQQQQGPDPRQAAIAHLDANIKKMRQDMEAASTAAITAEHAVRDGKGTGEDAKQALERYWEAYEAHQNAITQKQIIRMSPAPQDPAKAAEERRTLELTVRAPDIMKDDIARGTADLELKKMAKASGNPNWRPTDEDIEKAFEAARRTLKMGKYADLDPTAHQRRATSGYPGGRAGGVKMSDHQSRALTADDVKRAKIWYDAVIGGDATDKQKLARYRNEVLSQPDE